jgi:mannosyltransferase OCH1-like enzyme
MTIPKHIFQSWKDHKKFPDHPYAIERQINSWKQLNPDYKYQLFTDDDVFDFVKTEFSEYFDIFEKIPPIKRADLWRYMVIYCYGGIYVDIDSICLKTLDSYILPSDTFISGLEYGPNDLPDSIKINDLSLFTNWIVIAKAGHPILREMIETTIDMLGEERDINFQTLSYDEWKKNVYCTTGPYHWSQVINKNIELEGNRFGSRDWFAIGEMLSEKASDCSWEEQRKVWEDAEEFYKCNPGPYSNDPVFLIHTYLGSWKKWHKPKGIKNKLKSKFKRLLK